MGTARDPAEIVARNLARIRQDIERCAAGRRVQLVCVTKYASDSAVRALLDAGAADLAENLLPRAAERFDALVGAGFSFHRHLIGPPQSRKVRQIPGHFDMFQALERFSVAEELQQLLKQAGGRLDVLVQVNIAGEEQKHGVAPEQTIELCEQLLEHCPALRLRGLMAVPPGPDAYTSLLKFEAASRAFFGQMRVLFDRMRDALPMAIGADTLSMGMSLDFVWAIEEGASMVRVGGALFDGLEG